MAIKIRSHRPRFTNIYFYIHVICICIFLYNTYIYVHMYICVYHVHMYMVDKSVRAMSVYLSYNPTLFSIIVVIAYSRSFSRLTFARTFALAIYSNISWFQLVLNVSPPSDYMPYVRNPQLH